MVYCPGPPPLRAGAGAMAPAGSSIFGRVSAVAPTKPATWVQVIGAAVGLGLAASGGAAVTPPCPPSLVETPPAAQPDSARQPSSASTPSVVTGARISWLH